MRHFASARFWHCYDALPTEVRRSADRSFALLKNDPHHPSLQFKPLLSGRFRSVRVGLHYRALGVPVAEGVQWFWIGSHSDYDRVIG